MKLPWRQRFFKHEAAPPPRECLEQWRTHPRLQGHLRAFLCRDAGTVVEVYNRRAPRLDRKGLLRATCHVAAWVALLPLEQASCRAGKSQLSPVSVLVLFLKRRGKARVTPWLWGILQLVAIRLQTFEQTVRETNHRHKPTLNRTQKQWKQLRKTIPPCIWRSLQQQGHGRAESIDRNSSSVPAAHDRTDVAEYEPHPCVEHEAESQYISHKRDDCVVMSSPAAPDMAYSAQQALIRGVGNQMDIQSDTNQRDDSIVSSSPTAHDSTDAAQQDHPFCVGEEAEGHSRLNEAEIPSVEQASGEQLRFSENESKALCTHWQDERSNSQLRRATRAAKLLSKEIEKWSSADYAERGSWIEMMATSFRTAQGDGDWRGMLGVLRKAVAALAAPRCRSEFHQSESLLDHDSEMRLRVCAEQQKELRRIVLRVMEALQGFEADQRVDCILTHLGLLIHRFEQRAGSVQAAACAKQWDRLKMELGRMLPSTVESDDCAVGTGSREIAKVMSSTLAKKRSGEESSSQAEQRDGPDAGGEATNEEAGSARAASKNHKRAKFEDRARIVDDDFQVGTKIKELPTIQHRPEQAKTLQCEACAYQMTSSWFFVHPRSGELRVLVPAHGHGQCTKLSRRWGHFRPADGSPTIKDNFSNVDYCVHQRLRTQCAPCGGSVMCAHGAQRHRCRFCRHQCRRRQTRVSDSKAKKTLAPKAE